MARLPMPALDAPSIESSAGSAEQQAVDRILSSRQFAKAPLLSSFLVYVCKRALDDGAARISEHEIGVHVFNRAAGFDPREDNIVRTYARNLRKRLQEYYATDGRDEAVCIEIPKGGYVPVFAVRELADAAADGGPGGGSSKDETARGSSTWPARGPGLWGVWALLFLLYSVTLCWLTRAVVHSTVPAQRRSALHPLWMELFDHDRDTFVVPGDVGFVILQQANRRVFSLPQYLDWSSVQTSGAPISMAYLKDETYTSVLNLNIISSLQMLPEAIPDRFVIRAAKNIRFDDLQDGNAILLGSNYSNPWDELFSEHLNFRFVNRPDENRYWIVNQHPLAGETAVYEPTAKANLHRTYAVIAFLPNLKDTGQVLLLQGLDAAGTQAAANMLFSGDELQQILRNAERAPGHLRSFEVLIEATSLDSDSHATGSHIVASRFYS